MKRLVLALCFVALGASGACASASAGAFAFWACTGLVLAALVVAGAFPVERYWAELRYVLLDPVGAFAAIALAAVFVVGFDATSVFQGATVSTVLTVVLRFHETVSRPGDGPTPPGDG